MGYLKNENNEIVLEAILTRYGREKLASTGKLDIVKFALADDEVDYQLYNTDHPNGTNYYDIAIVQLPLLEPFPDESDVLRYKLYTSDDEISTTYILDASYPTVFTSGIPSSNTSYAITPFLTPPPSSMNNIFYTAKIRDTFGVDVSLVGNVDDDIGLTNYILNARQYYNSLPNVVADGASSSTGTNATARSRNVSQRPAGTGTPSSVKTTTNQLIAVGHTFTFTVNTMPRSEKTFTMDITVGGGVSANTKTFTIKTLARSIIINE